MHKQPSLSQNHNQERSQSVTAKSDGNTHQTIKKFTELLLRDRLKRALSRASLKYHSKNNPQFFPSNNFVKGDGGYFQRTLLVQFYLHKRHKLPLSLKQN